MGAGRVASLGGSLTVTRKDFLLGLAALLMASALPALYFGVDFAIACRCIFSLPLPALVLVALSMTAAHAAERL